MSGVRNYGDYTFIQLFFTLNNLLSNMGRIDFNRKQKKKIILVVDPLNNISIFVVVFLRLKSVSESNLSLINK